MMKCKYFDLDTQVLSDNIGLIFPGWKRGDERVCILSPHDDDAIIGAGYSIAAAQENGAKIFVFVFCKGNAGYSTIGEKDTIESIRKSETIKAYEKIGVNKENISFFDYSDFSIIQSIGWRLNHGGEGSFKKVMTAFRENRITRVIIPNHYREHLDHMAVSIIGSYDSPQAGDPILVDWAGPNNVRSMLQYSVWADLSPEDMLTCGRRKGLRANRIIIVPQDVEERTRKGIAEYKSQGNIINGLIESREERRTKNGGYIEVYLSFDPRPKLDYRPYLEAIRDVS